MRMGWQALLSALNPDATPFPYFTDLTGSERVPFSFQEMGGSSPPLISSGSGQDERISLGENMNGKKRAVNPVSFRAIAIIIGLIIWCLPRQPG